jgi:uncharacterized integral membrane protein
MANFLSSLIIAIWIGAIALISVQNAKLVSLQFLGFQSVQIPFGLLLGFSAAVGVVGMGLILPALQGSTQTRQRVDEFEDR